MKSGVSEHKVRTGLTDFGAVKHGAEVDGFDMPAAPLQEMCGGH